MKHAELSPERQQQIIIDFQEIGMNPAAFGAYLREKVDEDRDLHAVHKQMMSKEEFFERKALLVSVEYLSVILTKQK
ncbi:MAG: hypothetical protein QM762_12370 [Chryseolinea sp.]